MDDGSDGPTMGEEEAAATRIQAIHRGRAARKGMRERQPPAGWRDGDEEDDQAAEPPEEAAETPEPPEEAATPPEEAAAAGELAARYVSGAKAAGRKVNPLVERSLLESAEAGGGGWAIEAPGSHKLAFSCRLGDADMQLFAQAFAQNVPQLTRLDLSCNQITDVGASTLAQSLLGARAKSLSTLSLRANSLGPRGCEDVCQALKQCPSLRRFDVSQNQIGRTGGLMLVELLQDSRSLLELFLADTESDIDVLVAVSATLLTGMPKLKVCNMENPRIATKQEDHTVHIGRMLRVNTHLSEIYLGKCRFRDEGIRQLVSFLIENKTLRVLDLRCNEIGAQGAVHLGTLLASDCQLSLLNLASNRIGERENVNGAKALAQALLSNRMLRALDLSNNSLCGEALLRVGEAMDQNSTLETVALFHNQWDQPSSFKFHQILNDRARILPLRTDFKTSQVDLKIDVCKIWDFKLS